MGNVVQLRSGGVGLLIAVDGSAQPEIRYWGTDLGELSAGAASAAALGVLGGIPHAVPDQLPSRGLVPGPADGYRGRPGLSGFRRGSSIAPLFTLTSLDHAAADGDVPARLDVVCDDVLAGLRVHSELLLDRHGTLRIRHTVINTGEDDFEVSGLAVVLPVPPVAQEIADFTGKWSGERAEQRLPVNQGAWTRENRRGRTAADAAYVTMVGTPGFRHRDGRVWAAHLAWSGDGVTWVEAQPDGTRAIGAAELLEPGEITLAPGEGYATPWVYAVCSVDGTDGISRRFHRTIRDRDSHPSAPRPVVLNTWEAVYFNHDLDTLGRLAEVAADLGVERFVLDDGWFGGRRDDTTSLGDWVESADMWPDGLGPLVHRVRGLGMQFGLWVEPEMINLDSDLYRAHPDWLLADPRRLPGPSRHQYVLDVARPEVSAHLFDQLDRLVKAHRIDFLKWDHNRDPIVPVHAGRGGVHEQTLAVYALLDRLRAANPGLEIESCASGGARVDLGILARTDRVWVSDCNDALERQSIQQGTRLLLPLELMGCHVGPPTSHTTSRTHDLSFRAATALFGHFGIEWDIASATEDDRAGLAAVIALYKRVRSLLHSGDLVTVDHPDPAALVHGVVATDRSLALFCYVQRTMSRFESPLPATIPGLDPNRTYLVERLAPTGGPHLRERAPAPWVRAEPFRSTGAALGAVGLAVPILEPEQALLLEFTAVD